MKVLIIDNYDSFTFNLYQAVGELLLLSDPSSVCEVVRNDAISVDEIELRGYDRIILSPGPGSPADEAYFGVCKGVILRVARSVPTLGVCLGLQGIAYCYGGQVMPAALPMHGKTSRIDHTEKGIFSGLAPNFAAMRYHSLVADEKTLPECLLVTARAENSSEVMALRHRKYPLAGVQFHPESFGTQQGKKLLSNFLAGKL